MESLNKKSFGMSVQFYEAAGQQPAGVGESLFEESSSNEAYIYGIPGPFELVMMDDRAEGLGPRRNWGAEKYFAIIP